MATQLSTNDSRTAIVNNSFDNSNITVRGREILWCKVVTTGEINLQTDIAEPPIAWNAAAWIEQEPDQFGRPVDKLNGYSGSLDENPLIGSKSSTTFLPEEYYFIRQKMNVSSPFFSLWEVMGGAGGCAKVASVQCVGNILAVTYCAG